MNRWILLFLLLVLCVSVHGQERALHFQLDAGFGSFTGDFKEHLQDSGAYTNSPTLDGMILIYPGSHFGIGLLLGSMTVIHPRSEPIEGIIRYQGLILEGFWQFGDFWLAPYGGAGFQDPGMTMSWYGSGFYDLGFHLGWELMEDISLSFGVGYRSSFLRSIIIAREYGLDDLDTLASLRISLGLRAEIH